jgi:CRISPR-associated protein Cmr6
MTKGVLKVNKTNKGKIFVELDKLNGKPPMPLSYIVFPDTSLSGKECEYIVDAKGIFMSIKVEGKEVWSRTPAPTASAAVQGQNANKDDSKFVDSFRMSDTFLPKDVQRLGSIDIDNFALKLQKAARYETNLNKDKYKFTFFKNDPRANVFFEIKANYGHLKDKFEDLCKRQAQQVERLFPGNSRKIELQPQWRFVLGLGGESVYETSMTLHHIYGIPFLPSSSIKGVLRGWVISQIFAHSDNIPSYEKDYPLVNAEHRAITMSKLFCTIFGCPKDSKKQKESKKELSALNGEHQGSVMFFDGLPTKAPVIKTDVMNVHYKDWYKDIGYSAPTDTQKTNPIHFLTVSNENGLTFQTHIACSDNRKLSEISKDYEIYIKDTTLTADSKLLDLVKHWLNSALSNHGIGAKTAVGYGYMQEQTK